MTPPAASSRGVTALLTLVALLLTAPVATPQPVHDLTAALDAAVDRVFAEAGVPGAIVGLSIPGTVEYVRTLGEGDTAAKTPMSLDDHTRIGSVTKTFTGTAVLQLVDQGRIRLSDPISRYVDGVPSGGVVTLDMLGRMRSGLFNYTTDEQFLDRYLEEGGQGPDAAAFTPRELVDIAFAHPLNFAPDTEFEYSNTNTVLLGMVIERVTGQRLGDYLAQHVTGPLGLTHTSFPANGAMPQPYTHGYAETPDGEPVDTTLWNPSVAWAAGAMISTYRDLRAWAPAVARGALLLPWTHRERTARPSEAAPGIGYMFALADFHGWIGHNGDIPGYQTVAVYLPERDATLVVMVNSDVSESASTKLAEAVTTVATPGNVYALPEPA
ncbi:beta-lactamase family protein [Mycobacterium manitobense]|uniref:Beta-lactamase family protein n=1 Tax=[Mycobacterium] manitobense TaxID=190147 RepID=A0A9X3BVN8_9MYCO|nr:beta-lactamase family protein [[Mycobacterium] manitobense]